MARAHSAEHPWRCLPVIAAAIDLLEATKQNGIQPSVTAVHSALAAATGAALASVPLTPPPPATDGGAPLWHRP
ncbi:hypothetical protein AB0883_18140 [Micromonospora sp. NPDC047812]|uniref:hypothetical protein n=1 Tax=Micromonospora sp. NPDC047812 TaxID=3155742 RepID=UPI00345450B1